MYIPTKDDFIEAYERALCERYEWARTDPQRLDAMLHQVREAIEGRQSKWSFNPTGAVLDAWKAIGKKTNGKTKMTINHLRSLPSVGVKTE